jgi:hypothetical protein
MGERVTGGSWFKAGRGRLKDVAKRTAPYRAVGQASLVALNPLGAQAAQQAHIAPLPTPTEIRQNVDAEQEKQWADWQELRLEQEAGKPVRQRPQSQGEAPARKAPAEGAKRDPKRDRERGSGR